MSEKIQKLQTTLARTDTRSLMLIWLCLYLDRKNLWYIISTFCISKKRTIIVHGNGKLLITNRKAMVVMVMMINLTVMRMRMGMSVMMMMIEI